MHEGLDAHKKRTVGVVVHEDGSREGPFTFRTTTEDLERQAKRMRNGTVYVEASTTGKGVVRFLRTRGVNAVLCHPDAMFNALRKNSNDEHDAEHWAVLGKLGAVKRAYLPTEYEDHVRSLTRRRHDVVDRMSALACQAKAVLARNLVKEPPGKLENESCRGRWSRLVLPPGDRVVLDGVLRELEFLVRERDELALAVFETTREDPVVATLLDIPGVDVVNAAVVRSEFGDMARFASPKQAASYAGVVPKNWQSGEAHGHGRVTKMGNSCLRHALVQAAHQAVKHPGALRRYYRRLRGRVGKQKAVVAVARKLVHVMWALVLHGEAYRDASVELARAKAWRREEVVRLLATGDHDGALRLLRTQDLKRAARRRKTRAAT